MTQQEKSNLSISTLLVLAMTAIMPMAVATGFSNFERARQVVLVVMGGLALIFWGVGMWRQKGVKVASPGVLGLGAAFLVMVVASLLWSPLMAFGAIGVLKWVGLGVVFLILVAPVGRGPEFMDWASAVAAGTIAAGAFGIYELLGGSALTPIWNPSGVAGGFDSLAFATAFYALALPLLVAAVAISAEKRRWLMGLALGLGTIHFVLVVDGLALTVVVLAMVLVGFGIRAFNSEQGGPSESMALKATAAVVMVAIIGAAIYDRPETETDAVDLPRTSRSAEFDLEVAADPESRWSYFAADRVESPLDQRYRSYLNSVTRGMWEQEPLWGHGAGGWWLQQTDVVDDADPVVRTLFHHYAAFKSPHNDYARILVEQGALGLLLFLLWLAGIATAVVGGARNGVSTEEDKVVFWALSTTFLVGLALMLFIPVLELGSSAIVWVGSAAMVVSLASRRVEGSRWLIMDDLFADKRALQVVLAIGAALGAGAMIGPGVIQARADLDRGFGDHLMLRTSFDEAVPYYQKAHALYPAHAEVLFNISLAHMYKGNSEAGEPAIREALEMRPFDSRFLVQAAYVALRTNRVDPALAHGNEALRTDPSNLRAYEVYAAALQRRGRYAESAVLLEAALDRNPPREFKVGVFVSLGILYSNQLANAEKALEHLENGWELMRPGPERELVANRVDELKIRIEREALEDAGMPVPPHLIQEEHDHDHHHHGPFHPPH